MERPMKTVPGESRVSENLGFEDHVDVDLLPPRAGSQKDACVVLW
jgi:hypothetical protein